MKEGISYCGAKTRKGGTCRHESGWGTEHPGTGRCKLHGGSSTGPRDVEQMRGNKRALKHGGHETILFESLTDLERELARTTPEDAARSVLTELKLLRVRTRRMMEREAKLMDDFSEEGTDLLLKLEANLNRVQGRTIQCAEILYEIETKARSGEDDGTLRDFVDAMNRIMNSGDEEDPIEN